MSPTAKKKTHWQEQPKQGSSIRFIIGFSQTKGRRTLRRSVTATMNKLGEEEGTPTPRLQDEAGHHAS